MKRTPHPARRARRITALVSGASYLGLTASIAAATALSNRSDDVAAEVPDVAPDTTEGQQNLPLVLDGEATPASTTTDPEPTSSIDLFASSITTGAEMTGSSEPSTTPAPTASTTVATTRPPSSTATTAVTTTQATTVTTTSSTLPTSTLATTTTEPATTSSVATSASTEPTTTTTTEPTTTTTTEATTTTTTEATTTTSEAS